MVREPLRGAGGIPKSWSGGASQPNSCSRSLPCISWALGTLSTSSAAPAPFSLGWIWAAGACGAVGACRGAGAGPAPGCSISPWRCSEMGGKEPGSVHAGFGRRASPRRVPALLRAVVANPCLCSHGACCPFAMQTPTKVKSCSPRVSGFPAPSHRRVPPVSPLTRSHLPSPPRVRVSVSGSRGLSRCAVVAEQGRVPAPGWLRAPCHRRALRVAAMERGVPISPARLCLPEGQSHLLPISSN